jgi:nitroreductase
MAGAPGDQMNISMGKELDHCTEILELTMIQARQYYTDQDTTAFKDVHELITGRWSPNAFAQSEISDQELQILFRAASLAPSSRNEQPWRYVYAHRGEVRFNEFVDCLNPNNAIWAQKAAVLMLSIAAVNHERGQRPNRFAMHDTGAANICLLLQARALSIYGHMIGGFDKAKAAETAGITDQFEPVCFIALGFPADHDGQDVSSVQKEPPTRSRKPVHSFAFHNKMF